MNHASSFISRSPVGLLIREAKVYSWKTRVSRVPSSRPFLRGLDLPLVIIDPLLGEPIQFV